jgi:mono/diheme cytochrome c family protein
VITQGKGRMFSYADRVLPEDRWAIAHYVKTLQAREVEPASGQGAPTP